MKGKLPLTRTDPANAGPIRPLPAGERWRQAHESHLSHGATAFTHLIRVRFAAHPLLRNRGRSIPRFRSLIRSGTASSLMAHEVLFLRLRCRYPLPWGEGFEPYDPGLEPGELGEKGEGLRPVHLVAGPRPTIDAAIPHPAALRLAALAKSGGPLPMGEGRSPWESAALGPRSEGRREAPGEGIVRCDPVLRISQF